jgi:hypothetical protein
MPPSHADPARQYKSHYGGDVRLPTYGFVIESPTFIAFLAESWNGKTYKDPTLFTIRSLDGQPNRSSRKVRIYHGLVRASFGWGQPAQPAGDQDRLPVEDDPDESRTDGHHRELRPDRRDREEDKKRMDT